MPSAAVHHPSPFGARPFVLFFATRVGSNTANQMLGVAAGWQIYELTQSPLHLGLVGLVQFLPPLCLTLFSGHMADYGNRKIILRCCYTVEFCVAIGLTVIVGMKAPSLAVFYALLFANAVARTFEGPSLQSLLPNLVRREMLSRAVAANSMGARISLLLGPSAGGFLYALGARVDFLMCGLLVLMAGVASGLFPALPPPPLRPRNEANWRSLFGGLAFIWKTKPMLGAMSLDLIATLFGGVTALLPIFARDILHIGPWGFGLLRSAPALGGLVTAALLSRFPLGRHGGWFIFIGMAAYGTGTIIFAFSHVTALSMLLLLFVGMGDMLSGVTRQTLIQILAPDDTRGRVLAVNTLFNNTAGQLGMFESGVTTEWLGLEGSVVFGGVAVLTVTALWIWLFPALHSIDWRKQVLEHRHS
jgi:MFS family permease